MYLRGDEIGEALTPLYVKNVVAARQAASVSAARDR